MPLQTRTDRSSQVQSLHSPQPYNHPGAPTFVAAFHLRFATSLQCLEVFVVEARRHWFGIPDMPDESLTDLSLFRWNPILFNPRSQ